MLVDGSLLYYRGCARVRVRAAQVDDDFESQTRKAVQVASHFQITPKATAIGYETHPRVMPRGT